MLKNESSLFFKKIVLIVCLFITVYFGVFVFLKAYFSAASLLFGIIVLTPLILYLESKNYTDSARFLFLFSEMFYLYFPTIGVKINIYADYYYIPAVMIALFVFKPEEKLKIAFGFFIAIFFWALGFWGPRPQLSPFWIPNDFPQLPFQTLNILGGLFLTIIYLIMYQKFLITQFKKNEEAIKYERSKGLHNSKLASLGEMSAGIAHEINTPLTMITSSTRLLKKHINDPEKFEERIASINKATDRISKIVNGLKKFSRTNEKEPYSLTPLSLIINETMLLADFKSKSSNVAIEINISTNSNIFCNDVEIEQVLVNLINNSVDAVKNLDQKWIKIKAFDQDQYVIVEVEDSGPMISKEVQEKLFQPFFTTKPVGEGTGLGLSISKGIIEEHGASISILNSRANTCFEIRFKKF